MKEFKDKLKDLRKSRMLSREELAEVLGVTPSAIGMYERGVRMPKQQILRAIAEYFAVDYDFLLGKNDNAQAAAADEKKAKPVEYATARSDSVEHNVQEVKTNYVVDEALETAKFIFEHPEYAELFKIVREIEKEKVDFVKTMIEKLK